MAQPNCAACGRFAGRMVRVERFSPLRVTCEACIYQQRLEYTRKRNEEKRVARLLPTKDDVLSAAYDEPMDAAAYWSRARV